MIELERRVVHLLGVTASPDGPWVAQVARNFVSELEDAGRRFRFLIRDRDAKFTTGFDAVLASVGIRAVRTPVASPRANAFAERFVRSVREDCLDHLLVFSRRHLEVVLGEYVRHYNGARSYRGLGLEPPLARPGQSSMVGTVVAATSSAASSTSTSGPPDPGILLRTLADALTTVVNRQRMRRCPPISLVARKSPRAASVPGPVFGPFTMVEASTATRVSGTPSDGHSTTRPTVPVRR